MNISTKGRYALRLLLDIGEQQELADAAAMDQGPIQSAAGTPSPTKSAAGPVCVSLKEVSERQGISKKYLEQIATRLVQAEILHVERGSHGGYSLLKPLSDMTLGEILRIMEGSISPAPCVGGDSELCYNCDAGCKIHPVWVGLDNVISRYVDSINLKEILEQGKCV